MGTQRDPFQKVFIGRDIGERDYDLSQTVVFVFHVDL